MIEVLNKKNQKVREKSAVYTAYIRFSSDRAIILSAGAIDMCKIKVGQYMHFVVLNNRTWCIKFNSDPSGFRVKPTTKLCSNVRIHAQSIIRIFREAFKHELPASFYIQYNQGAEHQGDPIYEILTHKPIAKHTMTKRELQGKNSNA